MAKKLTHLGIELVICPHVPKDHIYLMPSSFRCPLCERERSFIYKLRRVFARRKAP